MKSACSAHPACESSYQNWIISGFGLRQRKKKPQNSLFRVIPKTRSDLYSARLVTLINHMKTDTLFYRLFQRWPKLALELLGLDYAGDSYRFGSEEIKQTAFRLDGIFTPITGDPEQPLIFAEVQYQPDADFYARFLSEITLYLRLHQPGRRWLAFVIYPARSVEKPASIEFEPFMGLPQLHRIYLEDYQNQQGLSLTLEFIRLIISGESQTMDLARELVERQ